MLLYIVSIHFPAVFGKMMALDCYLKILDVEQTINPHTY